MFRRSLTLLALAALTTLSAEAQEVRRGSIYDVHRGPVMMTSNKTARRTGDLVTVLVSEVQDLKNEEKSDLTKINNLDYAISNLDVAPNAFNPLPAIGATKNDLFNGKANYEKKGRFEVRLTAVVMDTLPNGNMVIQGRRELRIDQELKVIEFTGIIRMYDVLADNTIKSEFVADARVRYTGSGPLTNATNRRGLSRWLHDAIDWVWPF